MSDNKKSSGFSTAKLREYYSGRIMPTGGLRNQVLQKKSTADYDVAWSDNVPNTAIKYNNITLSSSGWTSSSGVYTQAITVSGIDSTSILDIRLDSTAFNAFDTAGSKYVYVENNNGSASVVSIGGAPSTDVSVVIIRQDSIIYNGLASIAVTGSWTNTQIEGSAVDITGLTVTATYNDTSTANVTNAVSVTPATWAGSGEQTVTISYSEYGVTKTCTKTCTVSAVLPTTLTVNGTFPKQYNGSEVDVTGITYTVTYNNGTTATKTNVTHTPTTWAEYGDNKPITFSYTESGTTITAIKYVKVYDEKALSSISCSGSWTNTQRKNSAVDITGLTVTATFNDDTTSDVTSLVTKSPATWTATGSQTCTLSYSYVGETQTTTKSCVTPSITVYEEEKTITEIRCDGSNARQFVGNAVDTTGLTFTAVYNVGSPETISVSSITISPATWTETGEKTATFSYGGKSCTRTFTVSNNVYENLVYEGDWTYTQYTDGPVNYTGLTFYMEYSDGTRSAAVSPTPNLDYWGSIAGEQTVTFSYTYGSDTRSVPIKKNIALKTLLSIAVTGSWDSSVTRYTGGTVSLTDFTVKAHYNNGAADETITNYNYSPETWSNTAGDQRVTITYNGMTAYTPYTTIVESPITEFFIAGTESAHAQYYGCAVDTTNLTFYGKRTNEQYVYNLQPTRITPATWQATGDQTATFYYTDTVYCTYTFHVNENIVTNLSYDSGTWPTQYKGSAVDISGIKFTATYASGATAVVTSSVTKSPNTWTSSEQTCTATFSYGGKSCTKDLYVINPMTSLTLASGSTWATQYASTAINTSGLTFTATYHDNTTVSPVTPTISSPASGYWSSAVGNQTCTFSYGDGTYTCTLNQTVNVQAAITYKRVGGTIFYLTGDLSSYTFYDSSKNVLSTKTVAGLADAYYYSGGSSSAHVYVYSTTMFTGLTWGADGTSVGITTDGIGYGKSNTATALANSACLTSGSIWYTLKNRVNDLYLGGCTDWFVGTKEEHNELKTYSSSLYQQNVWSSVETDSTNATCWYYGTSFRTWASNTLKTVSATLIPMRSF